MTVFHKISDMISDDVVFDISDKMDSIGNDIYMKIEGLNPCGSIKLKTAKYIIEDIKKKNNSNNLNLIESSSGNLGISLASICADEGYYFECVVDKNTLMEKIQHIRVFGAKVVVIAKEDNNGGFLTSRINYIKSRISQDSSLIWTNQYGSYANIMAHYDTTAPSLMREIGNIDYLFVGAGTTGTLLGCLKYFHEFSPNTRIIAVDATGSVTFGGHPQKRYIPGIGTSMSPEMLNKFNLYPPHEIIYVDEVDTIHQCRNFSRRTGLLVGGSTGSVIDAVERYVKKHRLTRKTIAIISADLGHSYIPTIYDDSWVNKHYPEIDGRDIVQLEAAAR